MGWGREARDRKGGVDPNSRHLFYRHPGVSFIMNKRSLFFVAALAFLCVSVQVGLSQSVDTIRICTYNVQRDNIPLTARTHLIKRILNQIGADVIIIQGLKDYSEFELFQDSVALLLDRPLADKFNCVFERPTSTQGYLSIFWDTTRFHWSSATFMGDATTSYRLHFNTSRGPDSIDIISGHWPEGD